MIIKGGKKRERELIDDLANFCVKKLMPRKKNLEVNISIKRNMIEDEGMFAGVIDTDDINTFDMDLDSSMSLRKKLLSVAREVQNMFINPTKEENK